MALSDLQKCENFFSLYVTNTPSTDYWRIGTIRCADPVASSA